MDKEKTIGTLGEMLYQAARASVAKGAIYEPGDHISTDAEAAWRGIAEAIVGIVDAKFSEGKEVKPRDEGT
jgi:hypothetical protein